MLGGIWIPIHLYAPVCLYAHTGANTPICPPYSYASVCSERHLHVVGVVGGPLHVGHLPYLMDTSPIWGMPPHMSYTHHSLISFPVHLYVEGISACYMGNIPLMLGVWGHQHICQALVAGNTSIGCPLCFILVPFLLFIMSHVSTMATTTVPPVMVVSSGLSSISSVTMAPSLMGLPSTSDQHEVILLQPLMPRFPGGVTGLAFMPQQ